MLRVPQLRPWKDGVEGDDLVLAGVEAGEFHRAFDGLGAAVAEKTFAEAGRA
jgi:hypothetical protein